MALHCVTCRIALPEHRRRCKYCAPCKRAYDKNWRLRRKAAGRPVVTAVVPYEKARVWAKQYNAQPRVRARRAEQMLQYSQRPDVHLKNQVRRKVRTAISNGTLTRHGCIKCGASAQAHHDDYSKPLDVIWFCPKHHAEHHKALRLREAA